MTGVIKKFAKEINFLNTSPFQNGIHREMQVYGWFNPQPRSMLGIDINSTSVKVIAISNANGKPCVEGYGCKLLPATEAETNPTKEMTTVTNSLRELGLQHPFSSNKAIIALPDSLVISKVIQLSVNLNHADIEEAVLIEVDNYLAYPLDDINIDFKILGYCRTKPTMFDVLMVAAKAEHVSRRVEAVSRAGLQVKIVDVESYAIERSLHFVVKKALPLQQGKLIVLINIGAVLTHFFVCDGEKTVFTRETVLGGQQLLALMRQHYDVSHEQALRMQREDMALPADYDIKVLKPFAENLLAQMQRTFQSFSPQPVISQILLTGSIAQLAKLALMMQEKTTILTRLINPLQYLTISKNLNLERIVEVGPSLMIACGLALRQGS